MWYQSDCLVYVFYLVFQWWLIPSAFVNRTNIIQCKLCVSQILYIIHTVQDYSVLYIKGVWPVIYAGCQLTHIWTLMLEKTEGQSRNDNP